MSEETFLQLCEHLSNNLWLQSLLIIVGTCFIEDAARCAVALLVSAGQVGWTLALASMTAGGMAGDIGLYLIGRYGTALLVRLRWIDRARLEWMVEYFQNHAVKTVLISRFLPGARAPAFCGAGVSRYPFPRYLLLLFVAAFAQALIFLKLGVYIGDKLLPPLRNPITRGIVVGALFGVGVLMHLAVGLIKKRSRAAAEQQQVNGKR